MQRSTVSNDDSEGLTVTPPSLVSISAEECSRFIHPTQTGAPPPLSQTNTLCSRHNKHPQTKSSWRKAPERWGCAGRRAQKGLCDGRATIRPGTKAPVSPGRDSGTVWPDSKQPTWLHWVSYSWSRQHRGSPGLPAWRKRRGMFFQGSTGGCWATPDPTTLSACQSWGPRLTA